MTITHAHQTETDLTTIVEKLEANLATLTINLLNYRTRIRHLEHEIYQCRQEIRHFNNERLQLKTARKGDQLNGFSM